MRPAAIAFGIIIVTALSGQSEAQTPRCYEMYKAGTPEYDACQERQYDLRVGKYFCFTENMVGFQFPLKNDFPDMTQTPTAGLIKPSVDKFFIEVKKLSPGKYTVQSEHNMISNQATGENPYDFISLSGRFRLYVNGIFVGMHNFGNQYMFYGKCEKIS